MKTLNPNDLGKTFLVENCSKIRIEDFLKQYRGKLKEHILNSELESLGWKIELATSQTHYNGTRLWFRCPLCNARAGVLFRHPLNNAIGCRKCLKLEYRKRRYKGMIESKTLST
ncbi:MAG: hypothetical protein AAB721_02205 [Patescibacteria group bacterium]